MKKILLLFFFGMIGTTSLTAKKIEGYYITLSSDTIKTIFKIPINFMTSQPVFEKIQSKVKFYDANNKKLKLRPQMAKEYGFICGGRRYRMVSRENIYANQIFGNQAMFLHLIKDGKLQLFKYYSSSGGGGYNAATGTMGGGGSIAIEQYLLQKQNEKNLFKAYEISFKKDMSNYLSDCPDLAAKIEQKILRSRDIEDIVDEYNRQCK